jgi:hypothetical protein
MILFRGTQRVGLPGVRKGVSYTPSLPVALVWSAVPGDAWGRTPPQFLPTSTVHFAKLNTKRVLDLGDNHTSMGIVLRALRYKKRGGIELDQVIRIFNYMQNRVTGKAPGGDFKYQEVGEDGETIEPDWSFRTQIQLWREDFQMYSDGDDNLLGRIIADTFIFADAPAVQRAALALGYEAIKYSDVFVGGTYAAPKLFGKDVDGEYLQGVDMEYDLEGEDVPTHVTYRPLTPGAIQPTGAMRSLELMRRLKPADLMEP